ncbi:A/G-specific adenine glycosylase [Solemya velum gill symbiont]|nr:A/G-specific adenine glycosylase [Solemya velum gill symbiont]
MTINPKLAEEFRRSLLAWFDLHGRKNLPWQQDATPYRVWISEIMLQQTQVSVVIPYFERFMQRFPDVKQLAQASQDEVLSHWSGLGYYSRARNLHKAARILDEQHAGVLPENVEKLQQLPGIGRSTAGAIMSLGSNRYAPILDGNVKRVLARVFMIDGWPGRAAAQKHMWALSEHLTPTKDVRAFNQAMMDLGATCCVRSSPDCSVCPLLQQCEAFQADSISDYPAKKPKKALPVKERVLLVVQNGEGNCLLHKRPQQGVWAGLWSFPEFASKDEAIDWYEQFSGKREAEVGQLPRRRHTFTHYHFDMLPLHLVTQESLFQVRDSDDCGWFDTGDISTIGIASPIAALIHEISPLSD